MRLLIILIMMFLNAPLLLAQAQGQITPEDVKRAALEACATIKAETSGLVMTGRFGLAPMGRKMEDAIALCGQLRSVEAIQPLVNALDASRYGTRPPPHDEWDEKSTGFAAVPALIRIGAPAIPALMEGFRDPPFLGQVAPLVWQMVAFPTIAAIAGPEGGVRAFEEAIAKAEKEADKEIYRKALARFRELEEVDLLVPGYQLFHGNVRETLEAARAERSEVKE
jgi:hypothetical protein